MLWYMHMFLMLMQLFLLLFLAFALTDLWEFDMGNALYQVHVTYV
jgi:hypothetical protein